MTPTFEYRIKTGSGMTFPMSSLVHARNQLAHYREVYPEATYNLECRMGPGDEWQKVER